jgi:Domain of unknown function (DUF5134)
VGLGVAWLDVPLGVGCLLAGLYHFGLALGRRAPAVPAAGYAVMGFGMAAMFVPAADPVPQAGWVAAFVASALWFGVGTVRGGSLFGDAGHHTVGALAMLFMLVAPGHGMGSGLLAPALALALAAWFLADIARLLAHPAVLAVPAPATAAAMGPSGGGALPASAASPVRGIPVACLVMNAAMALMLIVMA